MQHKHHDLIVAWAKGAKIEWYCSTLDQWEPVGSLAPCWDKTTKYRIKPEPKPDVVLYGKISVKSGYGFVEPVGVSPKRLNTDTCMFIFDGETGALKDAQVLARLV